MKKYNKSRKIGRSLTYLYGGMMALFVAITTVVFCNYYLQDIYDEDLSGLCRQLANTLGVHCDFVEEYSLDETNKKLQEEFEYMRIFSKGNHIQVWVINNDRRLLSYSEDKNLMEADEIPNRYNAMIDELLAGKSITNSSYRSIWNRNMYGLGEPIRNVEGKTIGAVIVQMSNIRVHHGLVLTMKAMMISVLIAAAITFFVFVFLARNLVRPIKMLENTTKELQKGNYDVHTEIRSKNELGSLAESIDELAVELSKYREKMNDLEKMRQFFISGISHELRTPVAVLSAMLELLCDDMVSGKDEIKEYHMQMQKECRSLGNLINDLLDISKLQVPDFKFQIAPCNLCLIVEDAYRSMLPIAQESKISLVFTKRCKETCQCLIHGDYTRIRQLLIIFIENAIKYSEPGKTVVLETHTTDSLCFVVRDEGMGMEEEELEHMFERFYRGSSAQNKPGSGLGLSIADLIIKRLDIGMSVQSKRGEGTMVMLDFTALKADPGKHYNTLSD